MADIVKVRRANTVLRVPADQADRYLADGYDVIGDNGEIEKESIPNDVNTLRIAYDRHVKRIAELEAELKKKTTSRKKSEE